jgi:tripartite-type tricarboxylate transporter receptor subunit TctC
LPVRGARGDTLEQGGRQIVALFDITFAGMAGAHAIAAVIADLGGSPMTMTPADFGKFIADETEKWGKVIRAAGIKAE